jgi:hypothetical protein
MPQHASVLKFETIRRQIDDLLHFVAWTDAAPDGIEPGKQFQAPYRFDHVVVGAGVQTGDNVLFGIAAGDENRRRCFTTLLSQSAQHFMPALVGEHPVDQEGIKTFSARTTKQVAAKTKDVRIVACHRKPGGQRFSLGGIILQKRYSHATNPAQDNGIFRPAAQLPSGRVACLYNGDSCSK